MNGFPFGREKRQDPVPTDGIAGQRREKIPQKRASPRTVLAIVLGLALIWEFVGRPLTEAVFEMKFESHLEDLLRLLLALGGM